MRKMLILSALLCVLTMIAPAQSIYYSGSPVIGSSCAGLPPNVAGYITPTGQIDVCQVVPPATSPVWVVRASPPALISGVLASIPSTCSPGVSFSRQSINLLDRKSTPVRQQIPGRFSLVWA